MRTIFVLTRLLILALCVAAIPAMAQRLDRSDEYVAHLGKKILDRIHKNEALISNGEGARASYLITDAPDPNWFYHSFTGDNALQLWLKRGWITQTTIGNDFSVQTETLDKYINGLRKSYLSNTKYKDQKIYFVISGIYNYDDINEKDKEYDWAAMRSVSFDSTVKENPGAAGWNAKESDLVNRILSKIKEDPRNEELKQIVDKESYIICFIFNLYKYFPGKQVVTEYVSADNNLAASRLTLHEVSVNTPKTFIIDGYFFSPGTDQELVNNISAYVAAHTTAGDSVLNETTVNRNDYLSAFIRNVFLSFSPITASTNCRTDPTLQDKLESLYSKGAGEGTADISASLTDLNADTRICLLGSLAVNYYCGDANNWLFRLGKCENLILDIIKSTPSEQRRQVLDYLNDNNNVLRSLIDELHDEGAGTENYSTFILTLSQYAYEAYANDYSALVTNPGYCSFLTYNPLKEYGAYSTEVRTNYNTDNSISFSFRNYDGPCYTQAWDENGDISYLSVERRLKPFEFIGIVPEINLPVKIISSGDSQAVKGKNVFVPAVMLYWNIKRTTTKEAIKSVEIAANAASFFMGLGEVKLTGTVLGKLLLSAEGTTTLANLVANSDSVKQAILKKEGGVEFIETIGNINNLSGLSTISYLGLSKLGRAVKFWNANKGELLATNMLEFDRIGVRMNDLEGGMVKDGFIYTKGAKPPDGLGLTGIFKVFSKSQLEILEPIIDQAVSNIIRDKALGKFIDWKKTAKAVEKMMKTITTGDLVELPAKEFLLRSLKADEEIFLKVHLQCYNAAGSEIGGSLREIDVLQFNKSTNRIEKGISAKLNKKIISKGRKADRTSLTIMSEIPDNGNELRNFLKNHPEFADFDKDKTLIPQIDKIKIKWEELASKSTDKSLPPSEFRKYLGPTKDFSQFPIDGISPENLGVTKQQLLEGTLELIKRKLPQ